MKKKAGPSRLADRLAVAAADARCICARSEGNVVCEKCSGKFVGRVQRTCPCHPNVLYLLDLGYCPNCKASWRSLAEKSAGELFKIDMARLTASTTAVILP